MKITENNKLKIVISVGDESGIGPEIILKALSSKEIPKNVDFILVGSKINLQNTYAHLNNLGLENLANPNNLEIHALNIVHNINCFACVCIREGMFFIGLLFHMI